MVGPVHCCKGLGVRKGCRGRVVLCLVGGWEGLVVSLMTTNSNNNNAKDVTIKVRSC